MKCPKCDYLGFETGDRCKNCGYDFSLLSIADSDPPDYDIYPAAVDDVPVHVIDDMGRHDRWLDHREEPLGSRLVPEPSPRDDVDEALDNALTSSLTPESPFQPSVPPPVVLFMSSGAVAATESALPLFTPTQDDDD